MSGLGGKRGAGEQGTSRLFHAYSRPSLLYCFLSQSCGDGERIVTGKVDWLRGWAGRVGWHGQLWT